MTLGRAAWCVGAVSETNQTSVANFKRTPNLFLQLDEIYHWEFQCFHIRLKL